MGTIMVWDKGTWAPENPDVDVSLRIGDLKFTLRGTKLKGSWVLVRARGPLRHTSGKPPWLLIKHRDAFASSEGIRRSRRRSVVSGRLLSEVAQDGEGDARKAMTGDPPDEVGPLTKMSTLRLPPTARTTSAEFWNPRALTDSYPASLSGAHTGCPPTALGSARLTAGRLPKPPQASERACDPSKRKFKCS